MLKKSLLLLLITVGIHGQDAQDQQAAAAQTFKDSFTILRKGSCAGYSDASCVQAYLLAVQIYMGSQIFSGQPDSFCAEARKPIVDKTGVRDQSMRDLMTVTREHYAALLMKLEAELQERGTPNQVTPLVELNSGAILYVPVENNNKN